MKRVLLSAIVIAAYIGYAIYQHTQTTNPLPVVAPKSIAQNIAATPLPTAVPTPPQTAAPFFVPTPKPTPTAKPASGYKDGNYTGLVADAFYGNIQVSVTISNGKIANISFLQYPNDRGTSIMINQQALPLLRQEAIAAQNANVDIISGATDSSQAFAQSLQSALNQAKA